MNRDILWGLLTLIGFGLFCISNHAKRIPVELTAVVGQRLAADGFAFASPEFSGRGAILRGEAPNAQERAGAAAVAAAVWGVRSVDNQLTVPADAPPASPAPESTQAVQEEIDALLSAEVIEFESGGDVLTPRGQEVVDQVAAVLQQNPDSRARIAGHTDSQGRASMNLDLSRRRAAAVLQALVAAGVDAARLRSEGFGETQPIADNATPEGRLRNRRVEVEIE